MEEDINTTEAPEVPVAEEKPAWVESAEAVKGVEIKRKKIVSNEEFIRTWNQSAYVRT
jgi:hypothetical protein